MSFGNGCAVTFRLADAVELLAEAEMVTVKLSAL